MPDLMYRGQPVRVPPTADVMQSLRPGGAKARFVQSLLEQVPPWMPGEDPIESEYFDNLDMWPRAVPVPPRKRVMWGIHAGHQARRPQPSPFVKIRPLPSTRNLTIELTGTPDKPVLARAYPAYEDPEGYDGYEPPLPWMASADNADGGMGTCLRFWRTHAYLLPGRMQTILVRDGILTNTPPAWWRQI